jgi:2-(1,2-epoxy-1,2-dihydrophenyl)acetyl-CoA isomerase
MTGDLVLMDVADAVVTLTLNRPQALNALTADLIDALNSRLDDALASGARCLLLTGAGRGFCAGADLASGISGMTSPESLDVGAILESHYNPLMLRLRTLPLPLVTAVNGPAAGAGCALALCGDIVVAAESAYFLQAFVNIGLVPDAGASWMLPRLAGRARALGMMMLGEKISAARALDWGMIWAVAEDHMLLHSAGELARRLAQGPTLALAMIRQGVAAALEEDFASSLRRERQDQRLAGRTQDFLEGANAFLSRRPPHFKGQ